jgi:hypothetical protein
MKPFYNGWSSVCIIQILYIRRDQDFIRNKIPLLAFLNFFVYLVIRTSSALYLAYLLSLKQEVRTEKPKNLLP